MPPNLFFHLQNPAVSSILSLHLAASPPPLAAPFHCKPASFGRIHLQSSSSLGDEQQSQPPRLLFPLRAGYESCARRYWLAVPFPPPSAILSPPGQRTSPYIHEPTQHHLTLNLHSSPTTFNPSRPADVPLRAASTSPPPVVFPLMRISH